MRMRKSGGLLFEPDDFPALNNLLDAAFLSERLSDEARDRLKLLRYAMNHVYLGIASDGAVVGTDGFHLLMQGLDIGLRRLAYTREGNEWVLVQAVRKAVQKHLSRHAVPSIKVVS